MKITRNSLMLAILIVVGSLAIATVYTYMSFQYRSSQVASDLKHTQVELPGVLQLSTSSQGTNFLPGQTVEIILSGSSKDVVVSGYDGIVQYDPAVLEFKDAKNERDDFDMFTSKKDRSVSITAGLKLSANPSALDNSILATLQFTAKKEGTSRMTLMFTSGSKTDSNLLSSKAQDILDHVTGVTVRVGNKVVVTKNPTTIGTKQFTLVESTLPESGCADCQSIARISVEENGTTHMLEYANGGFVGKVEREKILGDQVYQLEDMQADSVTLIVAKN